MKVARRIDQIFHGRYVLERKLGSGGMGMVFLVRSQDLSAKRYALKIIDKHSPENSSVDVYSEIRILQGLKHPNILSIFEATEDSRYVYIIQEFIKGRTLSELRDDPHTVDVINEETVILWMTDVAEALAYLHSNNIVHRDIKPQNIMIDSRGSAIVIDFGLARRISTISRTGGSVMGSAPYSPLERLEGVPDDIKTDIYAYGTSFYSVLRRAIPNVSGKELNTLRSSNRSIKQYYMSAYRTMVHDLDGIENEDIRELIRGCIDVHPERRIKDFNTVRYKLRSLGEVEKSHQERKRRLKSVKRSLVAVFIIGIILTGLGIVQMKRDHDHRFERILQESETAYDSGSYSESVGIAEKAVDFDPDDERGYITKYKAMTALAFETGSTDAYADLIIEIQNDVAEMPELGDNLYVATYLANAFFETGDMSSAIKVLEGRDDLGDDQLMLLGHAYYRNGQDSKAQECLEKMTADIPQRFYLEALTREKTDPDGAITCYRKVLDSEEPAGMFSDLRRKALSQTAQLLIDRGDYSKAASLLNEEFGRDESLSHSAKLNIMLLDCYYQMQDHAGTIKQADVVLSIIDDAGAYAKKTEAQALSGDYDRALDTIEKWENAFPQDPSPHIQRAYIYERIAAAAHNNERSDWRDRARDFIRVYEEERGWLEQHGAVDGAFYGLDAEYRKFKELI